MKQITIILIGTTHDTKNETKIFQIINDNIKQKNIHWLCEGDTHGRNCESIKDNNIHLITDALFVNMLIMDFHNDKEFMDEFYGRIIELFITMSKFNVGIPNNYQKLINLTNNDTTITTLNTHLRNIPINDLKNDLKKIILDILNYAKNNNIIDKYFEKCVFDFYDDVNVCEDTILTIMREKSFINIILNKIKNLDNAKHYIIVTVGMDHCKPLNDILIKFNIKVKILNY